MPCRVRFEIAGGLVLLLACSHAPGAAQQVDALGMGSVRPAGPQAPVPSSAAATLISSCPAPARAVTGLTFDGTNLWVVDWWTRHALKLDPATCAEVGSIPLPGTYPTGLEWDGSALLLADGDGNTIYRLSPVDGTILSSFPSHGTFPTGVTFTGEVWNCSTGCNYDYCVPDEIDRQTPAGVHLQTFPALGTFPTGLAFDGTYLWHSDNIAGLIYRLNPVTLAVLDSFPAPGPYPNDLAWDGQYLWVAENVSPPQLFKYDVGRPTPTRTKSWAALKSFYR